MTGAVWRQLIASVMAACNWLDKPVEAAKQRVVRIVDQRRYALRDVSDALRHDQTVLAEPATNRVGLRGASFEEPLANAVP